MLALTSTLNKLIKRLEEKQSPELVKRHRKRRVVPRKPPPTPQPAGESVRREGVAQAFVSSPQLADPVLSLPRERSLSSFFPEHCSLSCLLPAASIPLPGYLLSILLGSSF